jgi:hypothetical protein
MNGELSIPPNRDLPPNRLVQRREHLMSEIAPRRSESQSRRLRVMAFVAAALIVLAGTASAIGAVRDFILDSGFIGLQPGATPSAPETGELVLSYKGMSATATLHGRPVERKIWVYADGRIIWSGGRSAEGANEFSSGYVEQRLTPEGVELQRSELVATALFDRSLSLLDPHAPVSFWGGVTLRRDGRLVRLNWTAPDDVFPGADDGFTPATPEQLSNLRRVDALVTDPASVLPSSAWAVREVRAYVPTYYSVCMTTSPPEDASELLSLLPAPAADVLRGKSLSRSESDIVEAREAGRIVVLGRQVTYCAKLTTEEAREVADPLSGFPPDLRSRGGEAALAYQLAEAVDNLDPTTIVFAAYLPGGWTAGG